MFRRFVFALVSIFGATAIIFLLSNLSTDPRYLYIPETGLGFSQEQWDALGEKLGLDRPLLVRYVIWLGNLARADFGQSVGFRRPVSELIFDKMGATLQLALGGWLFAVGVGVPLGVISAVRRATPWDYIGRGFALFGQALPAFWTGIMAILLFSVVLRWLPAGTRGEGLSVQHFILPSMVLGWPAAAGLTRLTRSAMLDVLDSEYVTLARAKGVGGVKVIWKHALRNALIPPVTSALLLMAGYLNGALVVETVFSWPGVGWLVLNRAVYDNDFPLLMGGVFFFIILFLAFAFLADLIYGLIDPRIRYQ